mmetsp:Transcript_27883/g.68570  ORF Transcript_27883/g.68570 Transcript_27883/m.68570 type:complete len:236 (-) Transcript_27883:464-1171(-)
MNPQLEAVYNNQCMHATIPLIDTLHVTHFIIQVAFIIKRVIHDWSDRLTSTQFADGVLWMAASASLLLVAHTCKLGPTSGVLWVKYPYDILFWVAASVVLQPNDPCLYMATETPATFLTLVLSLYSSLLVYHPPVRIMLRYLAFMHALGFVKVASVSWWLGGSLDFIHPNLKANLPTFFLLLMAVNACTVLVSAIKELSMRKFTISLMGDSKQWNKLLLRLRDEGGEGSETKKAQ